MTLGQTEAAIPSGLRIDDRLERWRRRGKHDRQIAEPRPHDGHVAGVVDDTLLLLEGGVVLFVDHDQPQLGKGQE